MPEPIAITPPSPIYRVARMSEPLRTSRITPEDAALSTAGNRFDVAGGGVLYCASSVRACFGETLARFRPSPRMTELMGRDAVEGQMPLGGIPVDWRIKRTIAHIEVDPTARFLDVDRAESMAWLDEQLDESTHLVDDERLDASVLRSRNRIVTRMIATTAWNAQNEDGEFLFDGLAYRSRIDADWICWAVFEGTRAFVVDRKPITLDDEDLKAVCDMWSLTIH